MVGHHSRGAMNTTIQTGQILKARSIGDHECVFTAEVIERKGNWATVKSAMRGVQRKKVMLDHNGCEFVYVLGQYSMAPLFRP